MSDVNQSSRAPDETPAGQPNPPEADVRSPADKDVMEIHAPHQPILTMKEALVHLAIVTVGILIALSLEGALRWREHRTLVAETHENLVKEIRDNAAELSGYAASATALQQQLDHAIEVAQTAMAGKLPPEASIELAYHGAELHTASRTTAEITGAFGFMDRADVARYARVYDRQATFQRLQDQLLANFVDALAGVQLLSSGVKASPLELEGWKRDLAVTHASVEMAKQVAATLNEEYRKALEGH